jgi:hypothetical protein
MISCITLEHTQIVDSSTDLLNVTNSSHKHTRGVLSSTLEVNLMYEYNETTQESTFQLSLTNVSLSYFNELELVFKVDGDQSTKSGISIIFDFNFTQVSYVIERIYQDSSIYELSKGFTLEEEKNEDLNITVTFQAQASSGENGTITILENTAIYNLPLISLDETNKELVIVPSNISFEGELFGSKEFSVFTLVNNTFNDSNYLSISLSFLAENFQSFNNRVKFVVNSIEQDSITFFRDDYNNLETNLNLEKGLNELEIIFHIEYSSDIISIININALGELIEEDTQGIFYSIEWDNGIDNSVNLNSFKPISAEDDLILNITIVCSFEGTIIFTGIDFRISFGTETISTGTISASKQSEQKQFVEIETYTTNYQEDLLIQFEATSSGSGTVYIYNSSSISISMIEHLQTQQYQKIFDDFEEITIYSLGSVTKRYYDVVYIEDNSKLFKVDFAMNFSFEGVEFQSITVSLLVNDFSAFSEIFNSQGEIIISDTISFSEGYNEIDLVITVMGHDSTVIFQNVGYTIKKSNEDPVSNPDLELTDIPFFKTPKNIAIGLFVLFDCWLLMGIILRIYRGHKIKKKHQTENDEFILEIAQLSQDSP